jgi:hypothetical protein
MACPAATTYVHSLTPPCLSSHDSSSTTVVSSTLPPQPQMTTIRDSFPIDWVHWAILARCCLQGSHRGAERTVRVEEREERQRPRRFRVPAPGPPSPGHEGARRLGAATSAPTGLHYRPHSQGHRPRPPARGRPRIRRARGTQPRPPPTHSILLLCFSLSAGERPLMLMVVTGPVHSAHRGGPGRQIAVRVPPR